MTEILTAATREALRDVMVRAGELVLSARRDGQELGVEAKGGSANYVTAYDKAVQALLEREFSELLPGCEFLAEEDPDNGGFKRGDRPVFKNGEGFTFVIDPIPQNAAPCYGQGSA